jgi:hypothetical protein
MPWYLATLLIVGVSVALLGLVAAFAWLMGREYDRHPWFRKWMDTEAAMHGAYLDQPDITPEYLDQIPGGWDKP